MAFPLSIYTCAHGSEFLNFSRHLDQWYFDTDDDILLLGDCGEGSKKSPHPHALQVDASTGYDETASGHLETRVVGVRRQSGLLHPVARRHQHQQARAEALLPVLQRQLNFSADLVHVAVAATLVELEMGWLCGDVLL